MGRIPKKQKEMALEKLDVNSNLMNVDEEIKINQTSDSSSPSDSNQYKSEKETFNYYSSDECEKSMSIYEKTKEGEKAIKNNSDDSMTRFLNSLNPYLVSVTERNIDLFPKSNKQPSERDTLFNNFINTNKSLKSSNILPNLNFSKLYMNNETYDSNYFIISSLINDKIYQLYIEHSKRTYSYYDKSVKLSQNRDQQLKGYDCSLKEIWNALIESIPEFVKSVILFAREIPGLNEISNNDFSIIINNRLFDFYIIMNSVLFINGESYMYLKDDIVYTREWHNKIKGKEKTDALFSFAEFFNSLNFTTKEKALLIAYVFTLPGIFSKNFLIYLLILLFELNYLKTKKDQNVQDLNTLRDLNEYYTRALLYEFDLNLRNCEFLANFSKVKINLQLFTILFRKILSFLFFFRCWLS